MIFRGSLLVWIFGLLAVATGGSGVLGAYAANPRAQPQAHSSRIPAANPTGWNIPVLCYHTFHHEDSSRTPGPLDETYEGLEDMLHYLRENGFRSFLPDGDPLQGKPDPQKVIITFDDGHVSQLRAADLLEEYGMRGIFFVIPSLIEVPRYPHMSSNHLSDLANRGHLIGVHGHRHVSMPVSGPEIIAVWDTVPELMMEIPGITDENLHSLAFPYGHYTPAVTRAMRPRYPLQYTVNPGYWDGSSTLIPRILITQETDREFYFDYLSGALAGPRELSMREPNGSRQSVIHFENPARLDPRALYIRAVSPDDDGRYYDSRSAAPFLSADDRDGHVLVFDVSAYLEAHHPIDHRALSFAVTEKVGEIYRFVSDGYLIWVTRVDAG